MEDFKLWGLIETDLPRIADGILSAAKAKLTDKHCTLISMMGDTGKGLTDSLDTVKEL